MCGPSEHAQPPYFYLLPCVSVCMMAAMKAIVEDLRAACKQIGRGWLPLIHDTVKSDWPWLQM